MIAPHRHQVVVTIVLVTTLVTMATNSDTSRPSPRISFNLTENCGVGYELGLIEDQITDQIPNYDADDVITYTVVDDKLELIDITSTGMVRVRNDVDRETICRVKNDPSHPAICTYKLNVAISYQTNPIIFLAIELTIEDVNDNPPKFDRPEITKSISENAVIGTVIRLTSATDPDVGVNDVLGYELVAGNSTPNLPFTLSNTSNPFGLLIPELFLKRTLDREDVTSYHMTVRCFDGGDPRKYGDVRVNVDVTDVNDNAPQFEKEEYTAEVGENDQPGKDIIQVRAFDVDHGDNAVIRYEFSADSTGKENFKIDEKSGWISLSRKLDYESSKTHHLSVVASDVGGNPLQSFATVTIKVLNVNDEAPQIRVKFLHNIQVSAANTIRLSEDAAIGTQVAFVTLTDAGGEKVECELESGDASDPDDDLKLALDYLKQNSYLLKVSRQLDREAKRVISIRIVAHDDGVPVKSNFTIIRIVLDDVNDNAPTFSSDVIQVGVNESAKPGDAVKAILAKDLDAEENKQISYTWSSLDGGDDVSDQFAIEEDSGMIRLAADAEPFDAEREISHFMFNLTATDHGQPPLHSSTIVNITVVDVNDNIPHFIGVPYSFHCNEDVPTNQVIGVVRATDADVDKSTNGKVDYSLLSCPQSTCPFYIEPATGEIMFNGDRAAIDRELRQTSNFNFVVQAMDRGDFPKRQLEQTSVEIIIDDVNDNVAVVTSPDYRKQFSYISVKLTDPDSRDEMTDDVITDVLLIGFGRRSTRPTRFPVQILAVQVDDVDKNVSITYEVTDGDQSEYFEIDANNGKIYLNVRSQADLRDLTDGCHVISVAVHDRGFPRDHLINTWVNIYVEKGTTKKKNSTEILMECTKSPFFPKSGAGNEDSGKNAKVTQVTLLVIIFGSILLFLVIIMVVMILKYRCRSNKHHRSYNCKESDLYHQAQSLTHPNSSVERHSRMENFYTDENGRQLHLQQDKRGSPPSDEGGRDSGTGDSMPHQPLDGDYIVDGGGDGYHHGVGGELVEMHPGHGGELVEMHPGGYMTQVSYQNYQPEYNDPQMRYHATPYYYDPVSNFDNQQQKQSMATSSVAKQPSFRNSPVMMTSQQQQQQQQDQYHYPLHSTSLARNLNASFASQRNIRGHQSPAPVTSSSVRYIQGKAYVNLQGGYDDVSSSNGSGNYRMYPATSSGYQQQQQQQDNDDDRALMTSYGDAYYDAPGSGAGGYHGDQVVALDDEEFTAANLLISNSSMAPPTGDHHHHYQPPSSSSSASPSPGATSNQDAPVATPTTTLAPASGDDVTGGDKLSTIREEIDAEEVVAQIDGLLL